MPDSNTHRRSLSPRAHLAALPASPHGRISGAELQSLGLRRDEVLDVSASTNPLGPSPWVTAALQDLVNSTAVGRYPDDGCMALRVALAAAAGVAPDWVSVANGSIELLWLLALAYLDPGDTVLVVEPTFGEYTRAARIAGAAVVEWRSAAEQEFQPDVNAIVAAIRRYAPRLVFLCNPNNPTGVCLDRAAVLQLLQAMEDGVLVVNEAYAAFSEGAPQLTDLVTDGRLCLLRSMTKDYGLAGLRLGYAVAPPTMIDALGRVRPPWSVNAAAQAAGLAALDDREHLARAQRDVAEGRAVLAAGLTRLGLRIFPAAANFMLVEVGNGQAFRTALLRQRVCVRDCASFGLPSCVRVGIQTPGESARVIAAVQAVLADA